MQVVEYMQALAARPREEIRAGIMHIQRVLQESPDSMPASDCPVQHVFAPGVYAREITMAEGSLVIGKLHRHAHVNVISAGRVRVLTEHGCTELAAPCTFVSEPGIKRVVLVLEDTVWTTIHPTNSTDLAEIEAEVIAPDYSELEISGECVTLQE